MFKWAVTKEIAGAETYARLAALGGLKKGRTRARETPGVTVVEDADVDATIPYLPEIVADMVRFQRLTSARPGEVCSLRPCDIDRSGNVWVYTPRRQGGQCGWICRRLQWRRHLGPDNRGARRLSSNRRGLCRLWSKDDP